MGHVIPFPSSRFPVITTPARTAVDAAIEALSAPSEAEIVAYQVQGDRSACCDCALRYHALTQSHAEAAWSGFYVDARLSGSDHVAAFYDAANRTFELAAQVACERVAAGLPAERR